MVHHFAGERHRSDQGSEEGLLDMVQGSKEGEEGNVHGEVMNNGMPHFGILYAFAWARKGIASFSGVRQVGLTGLARMEGSKGECTRDHGHMTYAMTCEMFFHMVSKAGHGLEMMQRWYRDAEGGSGGSGLDQVHKNG